MNYRFSFMFTFVRTIHSGSFQCIWLDIITLGLEQVPWAAALEQPVAQAVRAEPVADRAAQAR